MLFRDYKANFERRKQKIKLPTGTVQIGGTCEAKSRPEMPPWMVDWAALYPDGNHFRVKEYYMPQAHPNYKQGQRKHFSFHYGPTTSTDIKGMPKTLLDRDTVIRIDCDQWGPHMHYVGTNHITQESIEGSFIVGDVDLFDFVEAVETHRNSSHCPFDEIMLFKLKKVGQK